MKTLRMLFMILVISALLAGCKNTPTAPEISPPTETPETVVSTPSETAESAQVSQPVQAIIGTREILELPQLPLAYQGTTTMANSPSGDLPVEAYRDSEGRVFYVHLPSNRVVEIDARNLLDTATELPELPPDEIYNKGLQYAIGLIPDFENRQSSLTYRGGAKVDVYFLDWLDETDPGLMMPPRLQIGLDEHGTLFALINTLPLEN